MIGWGDPIRSNPVQTRCAFTPYTTLHPSHYIAEATAKLIEHEKALARGHGQGNRASISFRAGVELFFRYVTRNNDEDPVCGWVGGRLYVLGVEEMGFGCGIFCVKLCICIGGGCWGPLHHQPPSCVCIPPSTHTTTTTQKPTPMGHPSPPIHTKQDFYALKELFIARGERFVKDALKSRAKIAELGHSFVRDGTVRFCRLLGGGGSSVWFTPAGSGLRCVERLLTYPFHPAIIRHRWC